MRNRSGYVLFALSILFILVITFRHPHTGGCTLGYHSGCPEPKESAPAKPRDCSNLNGSARYECDALELYQRHHRETMRIRNVPRP